jgi:hypothetical protein
MTPQPPMPSTRRRPIPGMATQAPPHQSPTREQPQADTGEPNGSPPRPQHEPPPVSESRSSSAPPPPANRDEQGGGQPAAAPVEKDGRHRRAASNYASTRLVNFRIPVDLHDRYRRLVREAEERHPRLRRPSLTELVIALLEEGPTTPDEVAGAIRRKRAAEHTEGA